MSIYLESTQVECFVGSTLVSAIFLGSTLVWDGASSGSGSAISESV